MLTDVQSFIDAGDVFDIAVDEGRLMHFNGGQAVIRMFPNRNTIMAIDFNGKYRPDISISINEQYVENHKHYGAEYKKRYEDWSMKEHLFNHYQQFPPEEVA